MGLFKWVSEERVLHLPFAFPFDLDNSMHVEPIKVALKQYFILFTVAFLLSTKFSMGWMW